MKRRGLCVLFAALAAVLLFVPASVRAESTLTASAAATPSPSPDIGMKGTPLDEFADGSIDGWIGGSGISSVTLTEEDGHNCLRAETESDTEDGLFTVMRLFGDDRRNLMEHSHVSTGIRIGENTDALYSVSVTLYSGLSAVTAETEIAGGAWYAISADISAWDVRTGVDFLEIRVHSAENAPTDAILLSGISATGTASLDSVHAFLTFGFTADGGSAVYEEGAYALDAGEDGILTLVANAAREEYAAGEGTAAFQIVLSGAKSGGTLSLAVSDAFSGVSSFAVSSSCTLYEGKNTYLLPFDPAVALHAYRLSFNSLFAAKEAVRLHAVSLVYLPETDTSAYAGKITSCTFSDGLSALTVTGTLPSKTVTDNIRGKIVLYEIPVWSDTETVLETGTPIAEIKVSTSFRFHVDLKGHEASAAVSRYAAVLVHEDSVIPIAPALFPDAASGEKRAYRSAVGLSGADAAGVFTANAAAVIVDVYVDELLGGVAGNNSGRLCIRGGRYYYLDTELLRALDDELRFYSAADVDVYLRLLCETDLSARNFTFSYDGASFFAFDVTNEDGAYMLSAVTDHLASSYPSVRGFIVGERLDSALYNGADMSNLAAYAALCADTMQIVYTAAAAHIPDVSVIAPIGHYLAEAENDSSAAADSVLFSVHLSRSIAESSNMPYGLLYVSDNAAEMVGHTENILSRMSVMHAAVPSELFLLWQPAFANAESIISEYSIRCEAVERLNIRAFFLGVERQTDTDALYRNLKYVEVAGDTGRTLHEYDAELLPNAPGEADYTSTYSLYDFSESFSTLDWIAGSGCSQLTTQADILAKDTRVMHAVFLSEDGDMFGKVSGNILCMMPAAVDFTAAPYISCSLRVNSSLESTDTAELVFVFGSDDARAEYAITVPTGQTVHVLCDLSEYGKIAAINSAAILVKADSPVTMDISEIRCHSNTHTQDALQNYFTASLAPDSAGTVTVAQVAVLLLLLVATLSVFALLSRKESARRKGIDP